MFVALPFVLSALGAPTVPAKRAVAALPQTVHMQVVAEWSPENLRIEAETVWLGVTRTVAFRDDGRHPDTRAGDGSWAASWGGEVVKLLPLHLYVAGEGVPRTEVSATVEALSAPTDHLIWILTGNPTPQVRRVPVALPTRPMGLAQTASVAAGFGWIGVLLLYVGWLLHRPAHDGRNA